MKEKNLMCRRTKESLYDMKKLINSLIIPMLILTGCGSSEITKKETDLESQSMSSVTQNETTVSSQSDDSAADMTEPVNLSDIVDESFETKTVSLVHTEKNTVEFDDGSVTFKLSAEKGDEDPYDCSAVIINNTDSLLYGDFSGLQGGGETVLAIQTTCSTIEPESECEKSLMFASLAENQPLKINFADIKIADATNKILYEVENFSYEYEWE